MPSNDMEKSCHVWLIYMYDMVLYVMLPQYVNNTDMIVHVCAEFKSLCNVQCTRRIPS